MNVTPEPHGPQEPDLPEYEYDDDGLNETLPVRARRPFLTRWTAGLMALLLGGIGFYVGVRVEKGKIPSSSSGGAASALERAFSGAGGAGAFSGSRTAGAGTSGRSGAFAGAFGGLGGGGGTIGSVSSVSGNTLYVTETGGNTVKVKLSGATTISKTESVGKSKIFPGDEVVITGTSGAGGTISATKLTDSGASGTSGTSTTSSGNSSSGSSGISSLFGS